MVLGVEVMANAGLPVVPVQSIDLPNRGMSAVTVWFAENAALITTSSWHRGTRLVQAFVDQVPPDVPDHVCVAEGVKVMPELPPQSPDFPVMADKSQLPAPAPVMSLKSALLTDTEAAVIVLAVPRVS